MYVSVLSLLSVVIHAADHVGTFGFGFSLAGSMTT